jgi:hypothetical protein
MTEEKKIPNPHGKQTKNGLPVKRERDAIEDKSK